MLTLWPWKQKILCLRRASKREREKKKRNFGFTRISPPANTWDTLEKRWDTLARMLAPALNNWQLIQIMHKRLICSFSWAGA
jgi:hypothetical protein